MPKAFASVAKAKRHKSNAFNFRLRHDDIPTYVLNQKAEECRSRRDSAGEATYLFASTRGMANALTVDEANRISRAYH